MPDSSPGTLKEQLQDYSRAIKLNPKCSEYYRSRGYAKAVLMDYKSALPDYNRAVENDPSNAEAYYNRGVAKIKTNQKESGCLDLEESRKLNFEKAIDLFEKYCH